MVVKIKKKYFLLANAIAIRVTIESLEVNKKYEIENMTTLQGSMGRGLRIDRYLCR